MRKAVVQFLAITSVAVFLSISCLSQTTDHDMSVSDQAQPGQTMQGMNMSESAFVDAFVRRFLGHGLAASFSF